MPWFVWVIIAVAVIALIVVEIRFGRNKLREAGVYVFPRTRFQTILLFPTQDDEGNPVRVMSVGSTYQSATYLDDDHVYDLVFEYDKLFERMFEPGKALPIRNVCMVGGGGYAYPKYLVSHHPQTRLDVVEIDPKVTSIASRYFFLDRLIVEYDTEETDRLALICDDGRAHLEARAADASLPRYDAIVNDSFVGQRPASCMATRQAARAIHQSLNPGGIYLTNVVSALEGEKAAFLHAVVATLATEFKHVHVVPCDPDELAERDNTLVIATDGDYWFSGTYALDPAALEGAEVLDDATAAKRVKELSRS